MEVNLAILIYMNIAHEHVSSRYAYVLEDTITIVLSSETKLWTNVSYFYTWQRSMSFQVSNLNHECLDPHWLTLNDKLSIYYTMST